MMWKHKFNKKIHIRTQSYADRMKVHLNEDKESLQKKFYQSKVDKQMGIVVSIY